MKFWVQYTDDRTMGEVKSFVKELNSLEELAQFAREQGHYVILKPGCFGNAKVLLGCEHRLEVYNDYH